MKHERLVAGLDIGSARTTVVIAEVVGAVPKRPGIRVLGVGQAPTTGMRRGVVANIEETARSVTQALEEAQRMAGATVESAFVGIAGEHVSAMTSKGIVAVAGDEISRADVERVNAVARAHAIPQDRELLHAIPQEYTVDRTGGIQVPVGMSGTRLETEMYLITIGSQPATNLRKSVERAGLRVRELVLEPLASALAVLSEDEKDMGVALVEMGATSTDVALFHEGKIRHLATVPYGGAHVTNDLVHGVGVTQSDAESLKEHYGVALESMVDPNEVIELPPSGAHSERQIPRELLAHIIHQRLDEIFDLVQRGLEGAGYGGRLSGGLVLTGGGAEMRGVAELAADVFGVSVRLGTPRDLVGGLRETVDSPRSVTAVGLALYGGSRIALGGASSAGNSAPGARRIQLPAPGVDKWAQRLKLWLQDFF
jgi:cell division protein FtsA